MRERSTRLADAIEQRQRVDIKPFDSAIRTDETQAVGRETQRPVRA